MSALLSLLPGCGLRSAVHTAPDLVSVHHARGTQWPGLASPTNDQGWLGVPTEGQLLHLGRGLGSGPTTAGRTIGDGVGTALGPLGGREPPLVGAAIGAHGAVLLVGARRGIRHGHCVSYAG